MCIYGNYINKAYKHTHTLGPSSFKPVAFFFSSECHSLTVLCLLCRWCLTSLGILLARYIVALPPGPFLDLDLSRACSLDFSLEFGSLISSFPGLLLLRPFSLLPILIPHGLTSTLDIGWLATWWMSSRLVHLDAEDLEELVEAASRLQSVVSRLAQRLSRPRTLEEPSDGILDWVVLEQKRPPQIQRIQQIRSEARFWSAEDGCPTTPEECFLLAEARIASGDQPRQRARQAFLDGFIDRFNFETHTNREEPVVTPDIALHWIIIRAPKLSDPCRVLSRAEAADLTADFDHTSLWRVYPTEAEVEIYCTGANLFVPHLLQWRRQQ